MIQQFVDRFMSRKEELRASFIQEPAEDYDDIFHRLCTILGVEKDESFDPAPDPGKITKIDHGHYQGTRLFIVPETRYQPSVYWSCLVEYGSCSVCDTFQSHCTYSEEPEERQKFADACVTMALHMVQSMKEI